MLRYPLRIVAIAAVVCTTAPVFAGGGGKPQGGNNGHTGGSRPVGYGYYHGVHYRYNYNYGYRYYGAWPYGYYVYDTTPTIVPVDINDPGVNTAEYESEERAAPVTTSIATVRVQAPDSAKLWFDGTATTQTGAVRTFTTPPLQAGQSYTYNVRACWLEDGRPVIRSRSVKVLAGEIANLDLR